MFARWVVLTVKTGKKIETVKKVQQEILPILEKCNGFLGVIPLDLLDEPLKVYAISLWEDRRDGERYETESFAAVTRILEPFLVLPPVVKHCTVDKAIPKKLVTTAGA